MPFEKGKPKTGGRKPGKANRLTSTLKDRIEQLINDQFSTIAQDISELDAKDRVTAYLKFLEYVMPKQREQKTDFSTLTDDQLNELVRRVMGRLD